METDDFWARVEAVRQEVARRRFAGESPWLEVGVGESLPEAVAKIVAAERSRTPLKIDGTELWLTEDLAREHFYRAQAALQFWNFYLAHRHLDEAAALSRDDLLHQRVGLFRLLTNFVRAVVTADPQSGARVDPERVAAEVDRLDRLPPAERDFYKSEVRRLAAALARRAEDPKLEAAWHFLRARSAFVREDAPGALIPLLRAYRVLVQGGLRSAEFLARQVELAHQLIRFWVGDGPQPAEAVAPESLAYKLHDALDAQAERDLGVRLSAMSGQFGLTLYMEANEGG